MASTPEPTGSSRALGPRPRLSVSALLAVIMAVIASGVAVGFDRLAGPNYEATGRLLVQDRDVLGLLLGDATASDDPTRDIETLAVIAQSQAFLELVVTDLGRPATDWAELADNFGATALPGTNVLELEVSASTSDEAVETIESATKLFPDYALSTLIAGDGSQNQAADEFAEQVKRIQRLNEISPQIQEISSPGESVQTRPDPVRSGLAGGVAGLVIGLLLALARHRRELRPAWAEEKRFSDSSPPP